MAARKKVARAYPSYAGSGVTMPVVPWQPAVPHSDIISITRYYKSQDHCLVFLPNCIELCSVCLYVMPLFSAGCESETAMVALSFTGSFITYLK